MVVFLRFYEERKGGGGPGSVSEEERANEKIVQVVPGGRVRLAADWGKLRGGEELVISHLDGPGLVVSPVKSNEELWIPASLVSNSAISRAWSFRPRRLDADGEGVRVPRELRAEEADGPPAILTMPCSIRAAAGGVARLAVEARHAERATVHWRKEGQEFNIERGDRFRVCRTADSLCLEIAPCQPSDSGIYYCRVERESGSCTAKIPLFVVGDNEDAWPKKNSNEVKELSTVAYDHSEPSADQLQRACPGNNEQTSSPMTSASDVEEKRVGWEAEQFVSRYLELEELGHGRFARVRRAKDRGTGQEVALKQTCRLRQSRSLTRAEYDFLRSIRHSNIVRAFALFENAPQPGVDTIVLELIKGSSLVGYLSEKQEYTEATVAKYAGQLLSALGWLHSRKRAHLDLKPENVLVDRATGLAKLIDLGEAVRAIPRDEVGPPTDLEFAAPESVLGRPTGSYTDMWAAGVFIYVLLSGLSPFLDDSIEETTANILKCDFCFPDEYFERISNNAKDLLGRLLCLRGEERATAQVCLVSPWLEISTGATIPSSRMAAFIERRAHRSKSLQDQNGSFYYS